MAARCRLRLLPVREIRPSKEVFFRPSLSNHQPAPRAAGLVPLRERTGFEGFIGVFVLRLPPIFDHGSAKLRWNLHPCVSSSEGLRVPPAIKPSLRGARPRRGGPKGRGRSVATA